MASSGGRKRTDRAQQQRARAYAARKELHDAQVRRRRRDNLIAGVAGGVIVLGIVAAQSAYYAVGPGSPQPTSSSTATSTPTPSATVTE